MEQDRELELLRKIEVLVMERERLRGALDAAADALDHIAIHHGIELAERSVYAARAALSS